MAGELSRISLSAVAAIGGALAISIAWSPGLLRAEPAPAAATPSASTPAPADAQTPAPKLGKMGKGVESPAFDNVRKALDALTPEQRKRFQENFMRWANLSPEEKKLLREREEVRKKVVAQEIEAAIKETGLELDPERREFFVKRYGEERRKIEEQLRKEMQEKRKPLVKDVVAKLKQEFSAPAPAVAPAAPQPN